MKCIEKYVYQQKKYVPINCKDYYFLYTEANKCENFLSFFTDFSHQYRNLVTEMCTYRTCKDETGL